MKRIGASSWQEAKEGLFVLFEDHQAEIVGLQLALARLKILIADDSCAVSHQSMGQYRTALLQAIDKIASVPRLPQGREYLKRNDWWATHDWVAGFDQCRNEVVRQLNGGDK